MPGFRRFNGTQSAPPSELQQKDPASQILEEQTRSAKKSGSLVGYLDGIDPEEHSLRISLRLIRHVFKADALSTQRNSDELRFSRLKPETRNNLRRETKRQI